MRILTSFFCGKDEGACRRSETEARRDRSPETADAGIYDGMGVLSSWFLRAGCNRAGDGRSFRETSVEREARERAAKRYATKPGARLEETCESAQSLFSATNLSCSLLYGFGFFAFFKILGTFAPRGRGFI